MSSLAFISQQVAIYCGIFILITGVFGGILNCIVFLSLRTFRETPAGFYLIAMSFFNIGQLVTSVFSRTMITGFNIDWTQNSLGYCKLRVALLRACSLVSLITMCLATVDQFVVTSSSRYWQQCSNIRVARYSLAVSIVISFCHEIPALIFNDLISAGNPGSTTCVNTSVLYSQYLTYVYLLALTGLLPILITVVFGSLAYRNVRQIPYRTMPLVRRELDKQLTSMVLVQVVHNVIAILPYNIVNILIRGTSLTRDPVLAQQLNFASLITGYVYYMYFSVSAKRRETNDLLCYLESLLHLRLCFASISSTAGSCALQPSPFPTAWTRDSIEQSNCSVSIAHYSQIIISKRISEDIKNSGNMQSR